MKDGLVTDEDITEAIKFALELNDFLSTKSVVRVHVLMAIAINIEKQFDDAPDAVEFIAKAVEAIRKKKGAKRCQPTS